MTAVAATSQKPLVAVVTTIPLVAEAIADAIEFADVRVFEGARDTEALLRWVQPDAVVADGEVDAAVAAAFGAARGTIVVHLDMSRRQLRVREGDTWREPESGALDVDAVRNVLAGELLSPKARA